MTTSTDRPGPHGLARPALSAQARARLRAATPSRFQLQGEARRDASAVESHLGFVEAVLRGVPLPAERRRPLEELLAQVRDRVEEPRLFLGVAGESSAGKRSLINAWLRDDLLRRLVLRGTAAVTFISHGPAPHADAVLATGERLTADRESLPDFLHEVSANEAVARRVLQVNVRHPAEVLADGLVIVDTPAVNGPDPRHAAVTALALRELCDGAVVVVPATAPASVTLFDFLRGPLGDVLHRCAFVVTMLDLVPPHERPDRLRLVRDRIANELRLPDPCVLPAVPVAVLDRPEERRHLALELEQNEATLWRRLCEQKLVTQMEGVSRLLEQLEQALREQAEAYRGRHEALRRGRIPDLRAFLDRARAERGFVLRDRTRDLAAQATKAVGKVRKATIAAARRLVDAATTRPELIAALSAGVPAALAGVAGELRQACQPFLARAQEAAAAEYAAFAKQFGELYRSLATLGDTAGLAEARPGDPGKPAPAAEDGLGNAFRGGAAVAPAAGCFAAGLFGAWFGPSLDDLKATARADLEEELRARFADAERRIADAVGQAIDLAQQEMDRLIDRHGEWYAALVERLTEQDRAEAARLRSLREQTTTAVREIAVRRGQLADARRRLCRQ